MAHKAGYFKTNNVDLQGMATFEEELFGPVAGIVKSSKQGRGYTIGQR